MQLRDYQRDACDAAFESLKAGRGNPLIDLPTGGGKSIIVAELARRAVEDYNGRVVILAHRKELLSQNVAKVRALTNCSTGLYSAGLGQRNTEADIVVAGVQSIHNKAHWLGRRHLVVIDEAHLTPKSDEGTYRSFISALESYNPRLRIIGLTATPFRLDSGKLWGDGELFSHVCYKGDIQWMIQRGYLCQLTNRPAETQYDTSKLHTRYGEFVKREVEDLFSSDGMAEAACRELVAKTQDRKAIIVFCAGVEHAEKVRDILADMTGERVDCVTGETPSLQRSATLEAFSRGDFRFCVNVDVLTTGFDNPRIDVVAIMRATQSAGLFCQMVGRGLRVYPSKTDCLVVDFGGNLKRHGPIDAIDFGKSKSSSGESEAPKKTCPGCGTEVQIGTRECECGFRFTVLERKHETQADTESQVLSEPETFVVTDWMFTRHFKKNAPEAPNSLRVTYFGEGDVQAIEEWVCLNHTGFAQRRAMNWWAEHSGENIADLAEALETDWVGAAIEVFNRGWLRRPTSLVVTRQGKFWRIVSREVGDFEKREEMEIPF